MRKPTAIAFNQKQFKMLIAVLTQGQINKNIKKTPDSSIIINI